MDPASTHPPTSEPKQSELDTSDTAFGSTNKTDRQQQLQGQGDHRLDVDWSKDSADKELGTKGGYNVPNEVLWPRSRLDILGMIRYIWYHYTLWCCLVIWVLITAYFIASCALKDKTQLSDILPLIFLYVFISFKMLFAFVPTTIVSRPIEHMFSKIVAEPVSRIPMYIKYTVGVVVLFAIVLGVSLGTKTSEQGNKLQRMQSLLGVLVYIAILAATSKHPKHIPWHTVIIGFLVQFCIGCIVIKTGWGHDLFSWLAQMASSLLEFSRYGAIFLLDKHIVEFDTFAVSVFPAVIFFAAFVQMVYYLGGMQWLLKKLGWIFYTIMDTSGVESIVAAASPFIGQNENVLLVKDYFESMTNSEIHACMTAGFATISGSTLQGYIALGVDAKNIITSCIMSIPCSLALSKLRYPETEVPLTKGKMVEPPKRTDEANILHALANGAAIGVNISLLVAANLIAVVSMVKLINFFLTWFGQFISINALTLELILGYIFYPFTWLLGVPGQDILKVSQLIGLKVISNEFVAFKKLQGQDENGAYYTKDMSHRAITIAQFALCGFGNLGSIAIQIGSLGSLAPSRKADVSRLALSACITGVCATLMTSAIIAMVM
ncbi:hypothetical protein EC988_001084 [Linderina pennispora]|nr:hypothetical protein EC988_001084 [Linderina pennispora]